MIAPIVDTHVHIFDRHTPLLESKWNPNGEEAPIDALMAVFAAHGVQRGVLSTSSIYGLNNEYFRQALARFPQLRATTNLPLDIGRASLAQLDRAGFVGIRLLWRPLADVPDLRSAEWQALLRLCADFGWHVHLTDRAERIGTTIGLLEAAGTRVVIDHMGMIDSADGIDDPGFVAILEAIERGRTWVKLGGAFRYSNPRRAEACGRAVIAAGGWERVMWGSDWPFVGHMGKVRYEDTMDCLGWAIDPAMRQRIESETASRFYF